MNNLTSTELKTLNNLSKALNPGVLLGQEIFDLISALKVTGTPVNAVNATKTLTVSGVVVHGETVTINNPSVPGMDIYHFITDDEYTPVPDGHRVIDVTSLSVKATVSLTVDTQPTSGNTMTIGSKVYTFVPDGTDTADGEVSIGTDLASAQAAIVAAINGTDQYNEAHPLVSAADFVGNDCAITALIGGTAGNSIVSTETFSAGTNIFSGANLSLGADVSASDAVQALVDSIESFDTQGVNSENGAGDTVVLTAVTAGEAGNLIELEETLANGSFANDDTTLTGGVNGTVGSEHKFMVDSSYLYVCVAENTVSGKNWRRISLGSAY